MTVLDLLTLLQNLADRGHGNNEVHLARDVRSRIELEVWQSAVGPFVAIIEVYP